jgi:hypothetical protein
MKITRHMSLNEKLQKPVDSMKRAERVQTMHLQLIPDEYSWLHEE